MALDWGGMLDVRVNESDTRRSAPEYSIYRHETPRGVAVLGKAVLARCERVFTWLFGAGLGSDLKGISWGSRGFETKRIPSRNLHCSVWPSMSDPSRIMETHNSDDTREVRVSSFSVKITVDLESSSWGLGMTVIANGFVGRGTRAKTRPL